LCINIFNQSDIEYLIDCYLSKNKIKHEQFIKSVFIRCNPDNKHFFVYKFIGDINNFNDI